MKLGNRKKEIGNRNGFTLIELIVVIAIIGLLASIISAGLSNSKIKGQNAAIIQQVSEYQKAVGLYIINNNNRYPDVGNTAAHCVGSGNKKCLWVGTEISTESSGPLTNLESYIPGLPFVDTPILAGIGTYKGLIYACNDINCNTANFYWPEINATSCTKGTIHPITLQAPYTGTNGVLCTQSAEGGSN